MTYKKPMANHARRWFILPVSARFAFKTLDGKKCSLKPATSGPLITEREMVWYNGLSETLMTELIAKRDDILTATEK